MGTGVSASYRYDGTISEANWAVIGRPQQVEYVEGCAVTAGAGTREAVVASGTVWQGNGYDTVSGATLTLAENTSGQPRIDYICCYINWTTNDTALVVVQGTPAASPAAPVWFTHPHRWRRLARSASRGSRQLRRRRHSIRAGVRPTTRPVDRVRPGRPRGPTSAGSTRLWRHAKTRPGTFTYAAWCRRPARSHHPWRNGSRPFPSCGDRRRVSRSPWPPRTGPRCRRRRAASTWRRSAMFRWSHRSQRPASRWYSLSGIRFTPST